MVERCPGQRWLTDEHPAQLPTRAAEGYPPPHPRPVNPWYAGPLDWPLDDVAPHPIHPLHRAGRAHRYKDRGKR
jgi:hypothetical protein